MIKPENLNSKLKKASYAVRGAIVDRAAQLEAEGRKIVYCNIGNPQALKQKPLTFPRQVLSLVEYPELPDRPGIEKFYPADAIERARHILKCCPNGLGAYTHSAGMPFIRKAVAEFITRRDGIPASAENIFLTDGASKGVQAAMTLLTNNENDGFMIPIPQYPLYSATIALYGAKQVNYYLDEQNSWQLNEEELKKSYAAAVKKGINPVAIVVINPGNPTGAILSEENIKMVLRFAREHKLAVLADEVYQENVYAPGMKFISFAKVLHETGDIDTTLFSFHSVSKGFLGECGQRGGYMEVRNMPKEAYAELMKLQSIGLCSNSAGQIITYIMVEPPKEGEPSYPLYRQERDTILQNLKKKAEMLYGGINEIEGMKAGTPQGAMYAFVRFDLPAEPGRNISEMSEEERLAYESRRNMDYCMALLEETGICVVPGAGFGQIPGTFHFRTTFLPPMEDMAGLVEKIKAFNRKYTEMLKNRK